MKLLSTILISCLLAVLTHSVQAKEYFFMAQEDNYYENPANWYPSYPGIEIAKEDHVVMMTDAHFNGYEIKIAGVMELQLGATLTSSDGRLIIETGGLLDNDGSVLVAEIQNAGKVYNRLSAIIHLHNYSASSEAHTHNSYSAQFTTLQTLVNEGRFDNYGDCQVGQNFTNVATFNQINRSKLEVAGDLLLVEGSTFNQSQKSTLSMGANKRKVDVSTQLAEIFN